MCGIAGYIAFGSKFPKKQQIENLFIGIESRGTDAAGIAYFKNGEIETVKAPLKATEFIKTEEWEKVEIPKLMIMHTRAATQGDEKTNSNNHPIVLENIALVHNGVIWNENDFGVNEETVDSMAMAIAYKKFEGNIDKIFEEVSGSYAIALLDKEKPNTLQLWRHTNPITLAIDKENQIVYFASTKEILKKSLEKKYEKWKGFFLEIPSKLKYWTPLDDHKLEITNKLDLYEKVEYKAKKFKSYTYVPTKHYTSKNDKRTPTVYELNQLFVNTSYIVTRCETCKKIYLTEAFPINGSEKCPWCSFTLAYGDFKW